MAIENTSGLVRESVTGEVSPAVGPPQGWKWFDYFVGFIALCALTLAFMGVGGLSGISLVGASFLYLILGLRRPAFIVAAIIILELTMRSYEIDILPGSISGLRYGPILLGIIAAALVFPNMSPRPSLGPGAMRVIVPAVALLALVTMATSFGIRPEATLEAFRYYGIGLIVMLMIPLLISDETDLKVVGKVALGVFVFSALASVAQHYDSVPDFGGARESARDYGRTVALSRSPVAAANTLIMGFLACFAMATALRLHNFWGLAFAAFTILLSVGWYFTGTRSALYAAVVGMLLLLPLMRGRVLMETLVAVLVIGGLVGNFVLNSGGRLTTTVDNDRSASGRIVLWKVALAIGMDNLELGTGYGTFSTISPDYLPEVDVSDQDRWLDAEVILSGQVHNDFLRLWQESGIIALASYLLLMVMSSVNFLSAYFRSDDPWLRGISLALFACMVGYAVHSFFHNSLNVTYTLWFLAGFSIAIAKVTTGSSEENRVSIGHAAS